MNIRSQVRHVHIHVVPVGNQSVIYLPTILYCNERYSVITEWCKKFIRYETYKLYMYTCPSDLRKVKQAVARRSGLCEPANLADIICISALIISLDMNWRQNKTLNTNGLRLV